MILPSKESDTEYPKDPVSEDYSNSISRLENLVEFDPLFLTKLDELTSSDDCKDFI